MSKPKFQYVCQNCGHASPKWLGKCPSCGEWNTLIEEALEPAGGAAGRSTGTPAIPVPITEVTEDQEPRTSTGFGELDRVLGGGLVRGSLVLVGGDPGMGKSTLLTAAAGRLASAGRAVLYVSGEESAAQVTMRTRRLGIAAPAFLLLAETRLDAIVDAAARVRPEVLIIDSIQAVYKPDLPSAPGSVGQVRECAAELLHLAKDSGPAVLLIGHVTKEGQLAGPRVLEHIVDTVLYFEGDPHHAYRVLRATKNRFGSTNEIGVFEMRADGLHEVSNPSAAFLSDRAREAPGSAVVCALEGSRPLLVEVQALVTPTVFGMPRRTASGVDYNRLVVLLAVLEKRAGLPLGSQDVYVSVAGGLTVDEPAVDLGIAAAVASSLRSRPVDEGTVAIGEVGLAGEIRAVPQLSRRLAEAGRLGFRRAVIPHAGAGERDRDGVEAVPVDDVAEALALLVG